MYWDPEKKLEVNVGYAVQEMLTALTHLSTNAGNTDTRLQSIVTAIQSMDSSVSMAVEHISEIAKDAKEVIQVSLPNAAMDMLRGENNRLQARVNAQDAEIYSLREELDKLKKVHKIPDLPVTVGDDDRLQNTAESGDNTNTQP
jgi:hypothetical protein